MQPTMTASTLAASRPQLTSFSSGSKAIITPPSHSMVLPGKSVKRSLQEGKREKKRKPNPPDDTPSVLEKFNEYKHILMGRGGGSNKNPANKVWRAAVDAKLGHYHQQGPKLKYGEKIAVSESVVEVMYKEGLRFATPGDSGSKMVRLQSFSEGVDKTNQRFRDTKPKSRPIPKVSKTSKNGNKSRKK